MNSRPVHKILRQTVELSIGNERDAGPVQEQISRLFQPGALPELERLFDRLTADRSWRVERLELDLGEIRGADWLQAFRRRLAECAARTLAAGDAPVPGRAAAAGADVAGTEAPSVVAPAQADFEELVGFLRHGRLPWWSGARPHDGWVAQRVAELEPPQIPTLADLAAAQSKVLRRLVIHLSAEELDRIVGAGLAGEGLDLVLLERELSAPSIWTPAQRLAWRERFWLPLFEQRARGEDAPPRRRAIIEHWLASLADVADAPPERLSTAADRLWRAGLPPAWRRELAVIRATLEPEAAKRTGVAAPEASPAAGATPASARRDLDDVARGAGPGAHRTNEPGDGAVRDRVAATATGSVAELEAVYVDGAGMVMLHPFLVELFAHLGLTDDGAFVDATARESGVHLLGYMAFGRAVAEPESTLAKLLCGMPLDEPLPPWQPDPTCIAAADDLLAAVLRHWSALRSASIEWLREQFLLRAGKIEGVDDGWKLTIETKAQDVLLGKLPWGIGVVTLPWMPAMLHVSWGN